MNKRGDVRGKGLGGIVKQTDEAIMHMMIDIMEIRKDPEYIGSLKEWVSREGIDAVFKKVIQMYSINLN